MLLLKRPYIFLIFLGSVTSFISFHQSPLQRQIVLFGPSREIKMHIAHDHDHNQDKSHTHLQIPQQKQVFDFIQHHPRRNVLIITTLLLTASTLIRKKITRLDIGLFSIIMGCLGVFDIMKASIKSWISKMQMLREGIIKHSTPISSNYFFKNNNLADRVTLLGVVVNILLSITKFLGGIAFNSAALVADAGHSLSDLFSDFITLWAVQIARIPADKDHPYGHGKFESVGSLFLSLTLIATGMSVGVWSYDKMVKILEGRRFTSAVLKAGAHTHTSGLFGLVATAVDSAVEVPSWPALILAAISIASKEWLFRITKRVGDSLNSQILIANAWHHRSDSFSSIISLFSIAAAIFLPGFLVADSMAGILVAGMILLTGFEVLFESIKQLTDASDEAIVPDIASVARDVEGVRGVVNVRARSVGSGSLVDMTILTDMKLSTSAAHGIAERTRWRIMESIPQVLDVLVRTQASNTICPLLSHNQRSNDEIQREVSLIVSKFGDAVDLKNIIVHYNNAAELSVDVLIGLKNSDLSITEAKMKAKEIRQALLQDEDIVQVDVQLDLSDNDNKPAPFTEEDKVV